MGWRDKIAKSLLERFGGLTTDAYHGTRRQFEGRAFKEQPISESYTIDRALGTHAARDPAMASEAFAGLPNDFNHIAYGTKTPMTPQVFPVKIPDESAFLQAVQPPYERAWPNHEQPWRDVKTDTAAIEQMAAAEAYRRDPDLLKAHLERGRAMREPDARAVSRALVAGESPMIEGKPRDLEKFLDNYGAPPGDDIKQRVTDLARDSWQDKGYAGIRYVNTAPMEAGAPGVKDVTSYIVFNPADIRSRFAQFDPSRWMDKDLLAGVAGTGVVGAGTLGALAAPDRYEMQQ